MVEISAWGFGSRGDFIKSGLRETREWARYFNLDWRVFAFEL